MAEINQFRIRQEMKEKSEKDKTGLDSAVKNTERGARFRFLRHSAGRGKRDSKYRRTEMNDHENKALESVLSFIPE